MSQIIKFSPGLKKLLKLVFTIPYFFQVHNITLSRKSNNFNGYYSDKSKLDSDAFDYDLYSALDSYFMNLPEITNNNFY